MRRTVLNGIEITNEITLGQVISLSILMVTLVGGGYFLRSEITQIRLEIVEARFELSGEILNSTRLTQRSMKSQ